MQSCCICPGYYHNPRTGTLLFPCNALLLLLILRIAYAAGCGRRRLLVVAAREAKRVVMLILDHFLLPVAGRFVVAVRPLP